MLDEERVGRLERQARRDMENPTWIQWGSYEISEWTGASCRIGKLKGGVTRGVRYEQAVDTLWLIEQARAATKNAETEG